MTSQQTLLKLDEVNTRYGDSQVLFDVSMDVDEGEVVALLGRNGAGKTTTLRSIIGIQPPFSGKIYYDGTDITDEETFNRANRGIGYVPETRRVFPNLTVEEHLRMVVDRDYRSAADELERVYELFPLLEDLKNRNGGNLSGGEQQMLVIARALVGPTELLLLDEPSEGLAPQIVESVFKTIQRLKSEMTILLVEQNYPMARAIADRYYIIDNGEIVSNGSLEELENNPELKDKYLGVT